MLFLDGLDYVGDLLNHRSLSLLRLQLLLLLNGLCTLRTDICIVAVHLAVKAHHRLVLLQVLLIQRQELTQLFTLDGLLLTIGVLVSNLAAVVAAHFI